MDDKMAEKVSVIIPTYKRNAFMVRRAVLSVLNQTYNDIELLIIDDSPDSFDNRAEVERMLYKINDDRIKYIKHDKNLGACAARNTGIKNSTGAYIAFLDDDDEWLPDKLELQIQKFTSDDVGLVFCKACYVNEIDGSIYEKNSLIYENDVFDKLIFSTNFIGSTSSVIIRRSCLEISGLFDEEMQSLQDFDLWLRIAAHYRVKYVDRPLINYYIHKGDRITTNYNKQIAGHERLIMKNKEYLDNHNKVRYFRYSMLLPYYASMRMYKKIFLIYLKCITMRPLALVKNMRLFLVIIYRIIYYHRKTLQH